MSRETRLLEWIPFAEEHPTEPEEYLIAGPTGPVSTLTWTGECWLLEVGMPIPMPVQMGVHMTCTHWMPLPAPPTFDVKS